jgi:hypothetical protein
MRPKKKVISVRVPIPMLEQIQTIADATDVVITDVVIAALHMYLCEHGPDILLKSVHDSHEQFMKYLEEQ